ncbi:MAG: acyl-CoA dehydrogenase family protein [Bacteroidia bacterium]|nr:acyl-CoA dehydrogenase family protein [Bacteroidia bacterium]
MNFEQSQKVRELTAQLSDFMKKWIYPLEQEYYSYTKNNPWKIFPSMKSLQDQAKQEKLWNLFLPREYGSLSPGLTNLEYALLAEQMGRVLWSSQVFNCSAPDTGNMEVLAKYGSDAQKEQWLKPLMNAEIRSAFLMTEPDIASSDATNIQTSIVKDGDDYIINGRKWWSTGAMNPDLRFYIVMGKTDPDADRYHQQSMIIVPSDTPGIKILRSLEVFGNEESPEGHAEIILENVRVPVENLIQSEGDGFRIAQGRLGPGRIHHCMRLIGAAQRSLDLMCERVSNRTAFGRSLSDFGSIRNDIALSKAEITQARLLTLAAADKIDRLGIKESKDLISMIKVVVPNMACQVIDRAIQAYGAAGVSQDTPLSGFWIYARAMRIADGPDAVHLNQLGRNTIKSYMKNKEA